MKKLLALLMAVGMTFSSSAFAISISDVKEEIPKEVEVNVPTSVVMKENGTGEEKWQNSPINIYSSGAKKYDFKATLDMSEVKSAYEKLYTNAKAIADELINSGAVSAGSVDKYLNFKNAAITGGFKVEIEYPAEIKIPQAMIDGTNMYGFAFETEGLSVTDVYKEISRTNASNKLTIDIAPKDGLTINDLMDADDEGKANGKLGNLTLTCEDVELTTSALGKYEIKGAVTGDTSVTVGSTSVKVIYNFDAISAAVNIVDMPSSSGGSSSGSKSVSVKFNTGDTGIKINTQTSKGKVVVDFDAIVVPEVEGKEFAGFYADPEFTQPITGKQTFDSDAEIYVKWVDAGEEPTEPTEPTEPIFTDNHIAYIIGYPEGTVKPEDNISREEVATVFYRLLRADKQIEIAATENNFSDVESDRWSNKAISSMAKGGYINGYESGTFKPELFITRAEFVTIIANMYKLDKTPATAFSDVTNGYWASGYIGAVSEKGWVNGYEDGTFRPEDYITRAEVMVTVNRMLNRKGDADGIHADAKIWSDISADDWFYLDVIEATNAHNYTTEDGIEKWTEIVDNNVWAEKPVFEDAE